MVTLGDRLDLVADRLAGLRRPVLAHLTLDGFDTQADQAGKHSARLAQLSEAFCRFEARLDRVGRADQVLTVAYSEMGRSLAENIACGTDDGSLSALFLSGTQFSAGVHCAWSPARTRQSPTDFRRLIATLNSDWLGRPASAVLGVRLAPLPLLDRSGLMLPAGT